MSIQPDASLTNIGLAAPVATCFGIILNVIFFLYMTRKNEKGMSEPMIYPFLARRLRPLRWEMNCVYYLLDIAF